VLSVFLTAATTKVEDIDGGPPGGCCRYFRPWPPLKLKTSMTGPQGVMSIFPTAATTEVEDVDGGDPGGDVRSPTVATTEEEDVDGEPPDLYHDM
jgi:hypothetical protein